MPYKFIARDLPWTTKRNWLWPAGDEKLVGVFHQVEDIEVIMQYVPADRRAVCVQAGGACGIWPLRFSQLFSMVYTVEPNAENFECLIANASDAKNIKATFAAFSDVVKTVRVQNDVEEKNNWGAGYIVDSDKGCPTIRIDEMDLTACDLICLDVEGAELDALKGAAETIRFHKPVIALEDKPLPHLARFNREVGDPEKWLAQFGYQVVKRVHRDVILAC